MNLIFATYIGELYSCLPLILVGLMVFLSYAVLGFAGILFLASGFLGLLYLLMTIFYIGSVSNDANKLIHLTSFNEQISTII